ncbi:alpha/beta hydrolase [Herbaspirillum seropedicae]|nr:alpha/beta hydrolase [Herbaspirillum sp. alder98]MCA1325861.1 alpha/beta hydrolase [Herbaspirillum sp. alder98]
MNDIAAPKRVLCPVEQSEAGYNLKAAFPDFPQVLARWQQATSAMRAELPAQDDIAYGDGALQKLDFYPAPGPRRPLLVFIHGGYWQGGDKRDIGFIAAPYVRAGVSVAVINYSLAPAARIEQMVDEVHAALDLLQQQADSLDIDVTRISLMGHSAGGHLAAQVAAERVARNQRALQAVFAISGLFDLAPLIPSSLNHALGLDATRADALSPVLMGAPGVTRVHTIVGHDETAQFHLQAQVIANCWPQQVVAHHDVPQTHHYTVLFPLAQADSPVCRAVLQALLD